MSSLTQAHGAGDVLSLRTVRSNADREINGIRNSQSASDTQRADEDVPSQPSQTYQCLLVFAGFMMTFHVIGINSIYGLFQVRMCSSYMGLLIDFLPAGRNSIRLPRRISEAPKARTLWCPLSGPSVAV